MRSARQAVADLRSVVQDTLRPLLAGQRVAALVDFPNYPNVGDSAIYLGQIACLRSLGLKRPAFICDFRTYDRRALARAAGDGLILLTGGGSFGDVWPIAQECREDVLRSFPSNPVVQLPQTIHFGSRNALDRARRTVGAHPRFQLLVRDRRSLEFARREFDAPATLCPDMAFCLGSLQRMAPPANDIVWLSRTDAESAHPAEASVLAGTERAAAGRADRSANHPEPAGTPPNGAIRVTDWIDEPVTPLLRTNYALMGMTLRSPSLHFSRRLLMRTFEPLARQRLRRGLRILSSARTIITDRLHGHILSLLLSIPHVILDNSYGKISSFYETWTHGSGLVRVAGSAGEAVAIAREWIAGGRSADTGPEDA